MTRSSRPRSRRPPAPAHARPRAGSRRPCRRSPPSGSRRGAAGRHAPRRTARAPPGRRASMHLLVRELGVQRDVAEAARDDAPVGPLVPVVEAVPPVVRDLEEQLVDRLGRDHLAARRDDEPLELAEEAARIAVGRDDDGLGTGLARATRRACARGSRRPHPRRARASRRTNRAGCSTPSGGWKSAAGIAAGERRRQVLAPLDGEAGRPQASYSARSSSRSSSSAASGGCPSLRNASPATRRELLELRLRPAPERRRRLLADRLGEHRIRRRRRRGARTRRSGRSRRLRSHVPRRA